jgi:hypothetical protein
MPIARMTGAARRRLGAMTCTGLLTLACPAFGACTEGTTPDCSGNPSPCGYPQPPDRAGDAASPPDGGGG